MLLFTMKFCIVILLLVKTILAITTITITRTVTLSIYVNSPPATDASTALISCHKGEVEPGPKTEAPQVTTETAIAPTESSGDGSLAKPENDFIENALYHHNIHRANHSAPIVTWSETLASAASQLASSCRYGHNTSIGIGGYGQNIAMYATTHNLGTKVDFIRTSITEYWYNSEISLYGETYGVEPDMASFHDWGHFSQIVWKRTAEVGCAVAFCDPKTGLARYPGYYSVCNYNPAGNYGGQFAANVLPPLGHETITA
jgi:uncharacterized protein YkwD